MGIGILLKNLAPLSLYLSGVGAALVAMAGDTRWALFLAAFLLPLRNVIERIQAFPLGNQFIDILLLGILIGGLVKSNGNNNDPIEKTKINTIAVVTGVYLLISVVWGGIYLFGGLNLDIHETRIQDCKNFLLMPAIFFLFSRNIKNKKDIWMVFALMCFSMFVADYYTINQIREHSSLISREQIKGTFQFLGPNEVAAFFNEYTIILMSVFYALKKGFNKWILLLLILINIFSILFLYSRGAYAGLTIGMLILFAFKDKKMLIPLILILCLWKVVLPENVVERIEQTKTESGQLDESSQRRITIWETAIDYFKSNPIIGIGFGSFRHLGLDLQDTHNIYVKILTEQGVVGLIILLSTLFFFVKEGFQLYQKGDDELSKSLGLGFVCCIFVLMVNNFFGDRWSYLEPNAYLWIFAGLVARLNVISQNPLSAKEILPNKSKPISINNDAQEEKVKKKVRYYDPPERI